MKPMNFSGILGSVSDAVIFIKKFENIKLAEEHLIRINKECNEKNG